MKRKVLPLILSLLMSMSCGSYAVLHTLEFDEFGSSPPDIFADGLSIEELTFGYTPGEGSSDQAIYNGSFSQESVFLSGDSLEGNVGGELTIAFDIPTNMLQFDAAVDGDGSTSFMKVELFGDTGNSMGEEMVPLYQILNGGLSEGHYSYYNPLDGGYASSAVIGFISSTAEEFYVDNLSYISTPEPASMMLLGLGGIVLRKRRGEKQQ